MTCSLYIFQHREIAYKGDLIEKIGEIEGVLGRAKLVRNDRNTWQMVLRRKKLNVNRKNRPYRMRKHGQRIEVES